MIKRIKSFKLIACIGALTLFTASCSDDDPTQSGNGISGQNWSDINDANLKGEILMYEFDAGGDWTASCADKWCSVLTDAGHQGKSALRIKVEPNESNTGRTSIVTVKVHGFSEPCNITVRQGDGFIEQGNGRYRDVNNWMYKFMAENYLWNEHLPDLTLDYSIDYQKFLLSMLEGVASFDDANHDDGHWMDGQRQGWYTFIESNAPVSRTVGTKYTDSGLYVTPTILGSKDDDPMGFTVMWVTPGSPAEEAGMKRGDFIDMVNNIAVTQTNYQSLGSSLIKGNVTARVNDVKFENGVAQISNQRNVTISSATYTDPAIYSSKVIVTTSGKRIGYLLYMGFDMAYDNQLMDVFNQFKTEKIDELIVDLRYNAGGHVLSSVLMGSLIAGQSQQGKTYVRTTYNTARTAKGEVGEYKIGTASNPESASGYDKLTEAMSKSVNLNRVFVIVSEYTASASELVINGLRGLDLTVNLIGTTTNGKNVGMEGIRNKFSNYTFDFYPITFYCENAKGFRDYSNGFKPELEIDDSHIYPGDFGTMNDQLSSAAIIWADSGNKPSLQSNGSRTATSTLRKLRMSIEMSTPLHRRQGGSIMFRDM